jgi:hypothetical protein
MGKTMTMMRERRKRKKRMMKMRIWMIHRSPFSLRRGANGLIYPPSYSLLTLGSL